MSRYFNLNLTFLVLLFVFLFYLVFIGISQILGSNHQEVAVSQTKEATPSANSIIKPPEFIQPEIAVKSPQELTIDLPILTYHYFRVVPNPEQDKVGVGLSVSPNLFREQLIYLRDKGYSPIDFHQLDLALKGESFLPPKPVILTVDDGYQDFYTSGLPIIKEFNFPITLFMVAGFVDRADGRYLTSQQLKEIEQSGLVKIGVHGYSHFNLTNSKVNLKKEIAEAKESLENLLGHELDLFAYPYGRYNDQVIERVKQAGFRLAASTDKGLTHSPSFRFRLKRNRVGSNMYQFRIALGETKPTSNYSSTNSTKSAVTD